MTMSTTSVGTGPAIDSINCRTSSGPNFASCRWIVGFSRRRVFSWGTSSERKATTREHVRFGRATFVVRLRPRCDQLDCQFIRPLAIVQNQHGRPIQRADRIEKAFVVFGDTNPLSGNPVPNIAGVATVTIQAGGVQPFSVIFNNSSVNYVLNNAGGDTVGIAGATGITQQGTGSLTLASPNSFTGAVQISAGRINVQNAAALGNSSGVTVASGAALELQGGLAFGTAVNTNTIPLSLAGNGLAGNAAGALNSVSGANSYAGPITLASAATINSSHAGDTLTLTGVINNGGNLLTIGGTGNVNVSNNAITGAGGLTYNGSGTLTLSAANGYTGNTTVASGTLRLADGTFNNITGSPLVTVAGGAFLNVAGLSSGVLTLNFGQTLTGSGTVTGGVTVSSGSTIAAAAGAKPTITGGLTLNDGSISSFMLGVPNDAGNPLTAFVNVTGGTMAVTGTNTVNLSGAAQTGTYELFAFTSGAPDANQFMIGTNTAGGAGLNFSFHVTGSEVDLFVVGGSASSAWNFSGDGNYGDMSKWDLGVIPNAPTQIATFGNGTTNSIANPPTATANVTIDGSYTLGGITFNNNQGTTYSLNQGGNGTGLKLDNNGNGATVTVATGAGNPTIAANLTLADDTSFDIASGSNLTLSVGGAGVVLGETGGSRSLIKSGPGTLTVSRPSSYTGSTTVNAGTLTTTSGGTLGAGPLIVNGNGVASVVNIGSSQSLSSLSGTVANSGSARVNVNSGTTTINQSSGTTFPGTVAVAGGAMLSKTNGGSLEIDGGLDFADSSAVSVGGGTLKLNVAAASVGVGATATVASNATLELAGPVSALTDSTTNLQRVDITNSGTLHVDASAVQQVGDVDGTGNVQIDSGASLTANHITATALIIGGDATHQSLVTIDVSDSHGHPLAESSGFAFAGLARCERTICQGA